MPKENFLKMIKLRISDLSLSYLKKKRNSKGKEIPCEKLNIYFQYEIELSKLKIILVEMKNRNVNGRHESHISL